jgi:GrpB-like predicted nucleotidyltransferase (UPF0157 family)
MTDPIIVVPYDERWPAEFQKIGESIRAVLGPLALRIDHIGSTAIPGTAAKPVIDVQVSLKSFDEIDTIVLAMRSIGFAYRPENPDKTQRYFREMPGNKRTHIHMRRTGSFQEVFSLLFRDYLRCHPEDAHGYEENKYELSLIHRDSRLNYLNGKGPLIWEIIMRANRWSQQTGWHPGASDA